MGRRADDTGGPGPSRNAPPLHPGSSGEAQSPLRKGVLDAVCVCVFQALVCRENHEVGWKP